MREKLGAVCGCWVVKSGGVVVSQGTSGSDSAWGHATGPGSLALEAECKMAPGVGTSDRVVGQC